MKILHVITDLNQGGAEAVLYQLISSTRHEISHRVVSLHGDGVYGERLREIGVKVDALGMPRGRVKFSGLLRLRGIMRDFSPDVVQTRLYHADLLGGLVAIFSGMLPVVWAVHSTELGTNKTRIVRRICAALSHIVPTFIITDAQKGARLHVSLGYPGKRMVVVPNGVDLSGFHDDEASRLQMRSELRIQPEAIVIGFVARWHPLKDHANLLRALAILKANRHKFLCVLAGSGMTADNPELMDLIRCNSLMDHVILLGPRNDVAAVMNAIDVHVLSSCAESMPVAVLEAMACGTPCVVTDVGDAASIVGDTGWVVPPRSPVELAAGIEAAFAVLAKGGKDALAMLCRRRIVENFSLDKMSEEYKRIWKASAKVSKNGTSDSTTK